jgi:hypothetical protein
MHRKRLLLLTLTPCLSFGASDMASHQCTTAQVLTQIRPGAGWVMQADSLDKLKWLDKKQKKPSKAEVEKAKQACLADATIREMRKTQARLEVKNPGTPTDKKVEDLILLLDMDK